MEDQNDSIPKYVLNEDENHVALIKEGLEARGGYCPCMPKKSEDTICPCKEYRERGFCRCNLYVE